MSLDKLRSNKRKRTSDIEEQFSVSDKSDSVQLSIEKREMVDRIKSEINKLPEKQRVVMYLRDIEGYTYKEIEEMTEYTLDQIKINIFRARQYIRKALGNKRNIA
jgi:RNA polymerase sigma-70 factor (ECF subfamily)